MLVAEGSKEGSCDGLFLLFYSYDTDDRCGDSCEFDCMRYKRDVVRVDGHEVGEFVSCCREVSESRNGLIEPSQIDVSSADCNVCFVEGDEVGVKGGFNFCLERMKILEGRNFNSELSEKLSRT